MTLTSVSPRRAAQPAPPTGVAPDAAPPLLDIVVPVYNEQTDLGPSVRRLHAYLRAGFPFSARITIADNASTDATWAIATELAAELPDVRAIHLPEKGRGRALRAAWLASDAAIVGYMDVDLSTDLGALLPLVAPILSGHSEVAIGSRLAPGARVVRGPKRELISRSYNRILRTVLRTRFRDAQCGFKAIRADVARRLLPAVEDEAWFFDTELLVLAERAGARIHEVPVDWTDDPDSRVDIVPTALADLRGVARLLGDAVAGRPVPDIGRPRPRSAGPGLARLARFVAVGLVSTVAYVVLFTVLRGSMTAPLANLVALAITAVGNTAVNRRYTFGVRGSSRPDRRPCRRDRVVRARAGDHDGIDRRAAVRRARCRAGDRARCPGRRQRRRDPHPVHDPPDVDRPTGPGSVRPAGPGPGPDDGWTGPMTAIAQPGIATPGDVAGDARHPLVRVLVGPTSQAIWVRPALVGVLGLAVVLYLWGLSISGFANTYYAAAAQAASQSWSAWFFGSLDASNFITLDKPPLATMVMGLSVRLLGLSSWSILLPEALAGIATVGILYATVRRAWGPAAATIAGLIMALTPVAVLIFRYDNPDAVLTLLLVGAAAALLRGIETGGLRWVVLAASLVGAAFLTKYLQAYLVLPAFVVTYAIAAPGGIGRRAVGLLIAAATVLVTSFWWVAIVEAIPVTMRPYIGGSQTNSVLDLIFGYDGLGRIFGGFGRSAGAVGGPGGGGFGGAGLGGGGVFGGNPGLLRLWNDQFAGQIAWLIPTAAIGFVVGLWETRARPRVDLGRAALILWGGWLLVHAIVFSFMSGIIHTYYTVVMVPAIAALVGAGLVALWKLRETTRYGGLLMAATVLVTSLTAWALLARTPDFAPGLGIGILVVGAATAIVLAVPGVLVARSLSVAAICLAVAAMLISPFAYDLETMGRGLDGGDPSAGPAMDRGNGFGGGAFGSGGGVFGRPEGGAALDTAAIEYLVANRGDAAWLVAVTSANEAGSIQLATGSPVMAMGGFSGSDPAPTLDELKAAIASGQLRFVLVGGGRGGPGGGDSSRDQWVTSACQAVTISGSTVSGLYDCSVAG